MQRAAIDSGLGKVVHVDPKPVSVAAAYYLACYLTKGDDRLDGMRRWANIGTYDGTGNRDISFDSPRIREIKAWQYYWRKQGRKAFVAYQMAIRCVDMGMSIPGTDPF